MMNAGDALLFIGVFLLLMALGGYIVDRHERKQRRQ